MGRNNFVDMAVDFPELGGENVNTAELPQDRVKVLMTFLVL
jgi:hypothetical protein